MIGYVIYVYWFYWNVFYIHTPIDLFDFVVCSRLDPSKFENYILSAFGEIQARHARKTLSPRYFPSYKTCAETAKSNHWGRARIFTHTLVHSYERLILKKLHQSQRSTKTTKKKCDETPAISSPLWLLTILQSLRTCLSPIYFLLLESNRSRSL